MNYQLPPDTEFLPTKRLFSQLLLYKELPSLPCPHCPGSSWEEVLTKELKSRVGSNLDAYLELLDLHMLVRSKQHESLSPEQKNNIKQKEQDLWLVLNTHAEHIDSCILKNEAPDWPKPRYYFFSLQSTIPL